MLKVRSRQSYLKTLGFYKGKITGIEDEATRNAYKKLQDKYFIRKADRDGVYGPNTDKLLLNAIRVHNHCENFTLTEFKCECGGKYCTGYPAYLSINLLDNIQSLRTQYGKPVTITSGMRCKGYNDSLVGSIPTSRHIKGQAVDFYGHMTATRLRRKSVIKKWYKLPYSNYAYSDTPNMGQAVHVDVSK